MERAELARRLLASLSRAGDLVHGSGAVAEARDAVVVEAREPPRFRAAFAEAVASGDTVFLANPDWGTTERAQFNALVAQRPAAQRPTANIQHSTSGGEPTATRGKSEIGNLKWETDADTRSNGQTPDKSQIKNPYRGQRPTSGESQMELGWLCIPTGGSAGRIRLARHDQDTLHAAVHGFVAHFGAARVNALGVLPLHHVGGLMGWLRAELTGGIFLDGDWKAIEAGVLPALPRAEDGWFLSLVPTQLQRLLARPAAAEWLRGFRAVLVGGGPAWPALAEVGARAGLPLAFTYGATETAAAVAALRPEEFLAGGRGCGAALPHARIRVGETEIVVEAESLFRGYWPARRPSMGLRADEGHVWRTGDMGFFDERGSLRVTGRRDALIVTGGEKVEPGEVEAALRATGQFADVAVIGVPDAEWGEAVVACYPAAAGGAGEGGRRAPDLAQVAAKLAGLAAFKRPKRFVAVADWPRDAAGKVSRSGLAALARATK